MGVLFLLVAFGYFIYFLVKVVIFSGKVGKKINRVITRD